MNELKNKILSGYEITRKEAVQLFIEPDVETLFSAANQLREHFMGNKADLCSVMNARSGKCSEDCKYCAQSSHYNTGIEAYDLIDREAAISRADENYKSGVHRFSLVTSGRGLNGDDFDNILEIFHHIHKHLPQLHLCASLGMISYQQALKLKEAGVLTYHHNLESSANYFPCICTTHTYDDRIHTIKEVLKTGLSVCSGGIIGMGESIEDRVDMALALKALGIKSIPVNVLHPITGTPMQGRSILQAPEILKTMAVYRFILPDAYIRYAGGRSALGSMQQKGFQAGVNAALVGNYLTTAGNNIKEDIAMITSAGFQL